MRHYSLRVLSLLVDFGQRQFVSLDDGLLIFNLDFLHPPFVLHDDLRNLDILLNEIPFILIPRMLLVED